MRRNLTAMAAIGALSALVLSGCSGSTPATREAAGESAAVDGRVLAQAGSGETVRMCASNSTSRMLQARIIVRGFDTYEVRVQPGTLRCFSLEGSLRPALSIRGSHTDIVQIQQLPTDPADPVEVSVDITEPPAHETVSLANDASVDYPGGVTVQRRDDGVVPVITVRAGLTYGATS